MKRTIDEPEGYPDTIARDLERADFEHAGDCDITYTEATDTVAITAANSVAAKALYDWLEDSKTHYRTEYVDATMEYRAAQQLARVVYEAVKDPEVGV